MLIACIQSDVTFAAPAENLDRVLAWMAKASESGREGADFVVFPECMLSGYTFESREQAIAASLEKSSDVFHQIAAAAKTLGQIVSIGFVERCGEKLYNSAALVGPNGVIACYRKIHLPHLGVDRFVDRGNRPYQADSVNIPGEGPVHVGLAICYDSSFPEPMRVLALCGVDVIALSTNWPNEAIHTSQIVPPARSMENHLYFVAANRVGFENGFGFCGRSSICGPDGAVLARSDDDRETLLVAEADLSVARNKRIVRTAETHTIDRFADRRPEFYTRVTEIDGQ